MPGANNSDAKLDAIRERIDQRGMRTPLSRGVERTIIGCIGDESLFVDQAEDGIRDYRVTGVQTCALPISRRRADRWYHRRLAPVFLNAWEAERELEELRAYLGDRYDHSRLVHHREEVEREEAAASDEGAFYRTSEAYLYDLTAFAMSGTKLHYLADLR